MDQHEVLPDCPQKNRERLALSVQEAEERILQGVAAPLEGLKLSRQKVDVESDLLLQVDEPLRFAFALSCA